jgi:hypothetical protein
MQQIRIKGKSEHQARMAAKRNRIETLVVRFCDLTPEERKEYRRLERKLKRKAKNS